MKTIAEIEQDLEKEGFKLSGGQEIGERYRMRQFCRRECEDGVSRITIVLFTPQPIEEEAIEPELEPEETGELDLRGYPFHLFKDMGKDEEVVLRYLQERGSNASLGEV